MAVLTRYFAPACLVLLLVAAYHPTLNADFVVWDDDDHVYENPNILAADGYRMAWKDWRDTAFYPVTFTTFFVEWRLADGEPWLFHLDNVVLHAANAVAAGLLARALGLPLGVSWAAAGLWALHPVGVASVAWVTERKNLLYVFFYMVALLSYLSSLNASPSRGRLFLAVSLLFGIASSLSKATAVTLPVAVILVHWVMDRPFDWRFLWRLLPYAVLALIVGLLHVYREEVTTSLGLGIRILIASRAVWFYICTFFWPVHLVAMYPRWSTEHALSWGVPALASLLGILMLGAWHFRRLPRPAWFAAGHLAVNAALVVGVVWFPYMRYSFVADHLFYFPSLGLALLTAMAADALLRRLQAPAGVAALLTVGAWLALAGATKEQTGLWRDTETLWGRTLAVNPSSTVAHNNLGVALIKAGRAEEALAHFNETLRYDPEDATAIFNLGVLAAGRGEWEDATTFYKKALRQNTANPLIWNNLGVVASERGELKKAAAFYRHALSLQPDDADAHTNLCAALAKGGDVEDAMEHCRVAIRLNPRSVKAHYRFGLVLAEQGRHADAAGHFATARNFEPENTEILVQLAHSLEAQGELAAARRWLATAVEIDPLDPALRYGLGMILLKLGEIDDGSEHLDESIALAPREKAGALHHDAGLLLEGHGARERAMLHYRKATVLSPDEPDAFYRLGTALAKQGHHREAEAEYRRVLELAPDHVEAMNNLGAALLAQGKTEEAVTYFERATRLAADDLEIRRNLALAQYKAGRVADAVAVLESALAGDAEIPELMNFLAWIRATSPMQQWRDAADAVRLAEGACAATNRTDPNYLDTLAAAYAEAGRYQDAVRIAERALVLTELDSELARDLRGRLALYRDGRPYRHD